MFFFVFGPVRLSRGCYVMYAPVVIYVRSFYFCLYALAFSFLFFSFQSDGGPPVRDRMPKKGGGGAEG